MQALLFLPDGGKLQHFKKWGPQLAKYGLINVITFL